MSIRAVAALKALFPGLIILSLFFPLSVSCQTRKALRPHQSLPVTDNGPMACRIEGKIAEILKPTTQDKGSICARYPCRARVKILEVSACGSSVSVPMNAGDTITLRFVYTLHATAKLFPSMKTHFPGLKEGDRFHANAEQRLVMGSAGEFAVSSYVRK